MPDHVMMIPMFSSPEPKAQAPLSVRCCCTSLSTISNLFFSKTPCSIKAKFYVEFPWVGGLKVYSQPLGHMTKIAATPRYGKTPSNSSLEPGTGRLISTKLGM